MNIELEKKENIEIFKSDLVNIFRLNDAELIDSFNSILIILLFDFFDFKLSLEKSLSSNEEKLTHKEFILEGRPTAPTVGNWLKDFIKKNGAGIFDNLVLTQYLTNSENAKKLDADERELLRKLLVTYRNIKFFPESMPSDDGEGWEIIPVSQEVESRKSPSSRAQAEGKVESLEKIKNLNDNLDEKPIIDRRVPLAMTDSNETKENPELEELKRMANFYVEGSLERKAIEEEIKKLNNE